MFKPIFKTAMAIAAVAVLFTACKKDGESSLKPNGQAKVLTCDTLQYTIKTDTVAPAGPWPTIYLDVATGAYATSSLGTETVTLTSNVNSTINEIPTVSTIRYLNSDSAICDLTEDDWDIAIPEASIGQDMNGSAPYDGYFDYPPVTPPAQPVATPVPNFYILVNDGTNIYAIKYRAIRGSVVTPPPSLTIKGEYDLTVRKIN